METQLLDGKQTAREIRSELKAQIQDCINKGMPAPCLAVILVGNDEASQVYVNNKEKACGWIGMKSLVCRMPAETTQGELLAKVRELNEDPGINGILVQLPLPRHLDADLVINAIDPAKDVDGFHPVNAGKLSIGHRDAFVSCTPAGVVQLLKRAGIEIASKHCVIAGRSNIVGKPLALLMLRENATVTICHSKTKNLSELTRQADIFIAAVGRPKMFGPEDIREGAVVVDVGMHRLEDGLCGDVDYEACMGKASYMTPVPGGVGPMTIAMLLSNCVQAYKAQLDIQS